MITSWRGVSCVSTLSNIENVIKIVIQNGEKKFLKPAASPTLCIYLVGSDHVTRCGIFIGCCKNMVTKKLKWFEVFAVKVHATFLVI